MDNSFTPDPGGHSRFPPVESLDELADRILNRVDHIIGECELNNKPLELDPARSQLFELFVMAETAGLVHEDAEPDLSADGICQALAAQWGLRDAAVMSHRAQEKLGEPYLVKMRSLWSVMRMWMEWSYAWQRWPEFHKISAAAPQPKPHSSDAHQERLE